MAEFWVDVDPATRDLYWGPGGRENAPDPSGRYVFEERSSGPFKFSRGFDELIYIWGADHHGTIARLKNAAQALGLDRDATNVLLFTLAESGILGLAGFLAIHGVFLVMIWKTHRLLDPRDPAFSCLAIGGALVLGKFVHAQLDHYWSRGSVMMAWSAAGMAVLAYRMVQERRHRSHLSCE